MCFTCSIFVDQIQKDFCEFYLFLKEILDFLVFLFGQNEFCVFHQKNWFSGFFARSSRLRSFPRKAVWQKLRLSKNQTENLATVSRLSRDLELLAKILCFSGTFRGCLATVSRLPIPRKTRVFSF